MSDQEEDPVEKATREYLEQYWYNHSKSFFNPPCQCDACKAAEAVEMNFLPDWGF